jgi:hypothetical protein
MFGLAKKISAENLCCTGLVGVASSRTQTVPPGPCVIVPLRQSVADYYQSAGNGD